MKYKQSFQIALALSSLLVAAVAASPAQAMIDGYVYSTDEKTPVRDSDGHCVRTISGKEYAITECNPKQPQAPADSDHDGVLDSTDKCPNTPAGVKVDANGCPLALDSDGDGVLDSLDKCPDTPKGEKVGADGCPLALDSDGDGVLDSLDKCPDTPKGEKVGADGCPLDSDGDGVLDSLDKCPDTPKGTPVDKEGCPLPKKVSISLAIEFDTGKAVIHPQYDEQIKKVAEFMTTYPGTTAVIEGHTDNVGKEASNLRLSTRRAESVRTYLIGKFGIAPQRLVAKGFGSSQPIADNATSEGRQKNRRITAVIEAMTVR